MLLADGIELFLVLGFAVGVSCTDTVFAALNDILILTVEMPEIISEELASSRFHLFRQIADTLLHCSSLLAVLFALVEAVALESSALREVIHCSAKNKTLCLVVEVELVMETDMAIGIRVLVQSVVCTLP